MTATEERDLLSALAKMTAERDAFRDENYELRKRLILLSTCEDIQALATRTLAALNENATMSSGK